MAARGERIEALDDSSLVTLWAYFIGAFAISWTLWVPVAFLFPDNAALPPWAIFLAAAGAYGPSLAAISTALIHGGAPELQLFLAKRLKTRVNWWWYIIVLFGPPAFVWSGAIVNVLMGGHVRLAGVEAIGRSALIFATFIPFGPLGEELGWRGYALRKLEAHFSPLVSSLVLGVVWAAWHAPSFWISPIGMPQRTLTAVVLWTAYTVSFSVLLSYVARRTNYSVLIAILLHATLNAGAAMGAAVLVASASDMQAIQRWSVYVQWLVVIAAATALARSREDDRATQS